MSHLRIYLFCYFILTITAYSLIAQNKSIDSLKKIIQLNPEDTNLVNALNTLGSKYTETDLDQSFKYAAKALALAKKLNFTTGLIKAYGLTGQVNYRYGKFDLALTYFDSSLVLAKRVNDKKRIGGIYNFRGRIFEKLGNYSLALQSHITSLRIRTEIADKPGIAGSYNNMGILYYDQGDYPEAMKNYFLALKMYESIGLKKNMANACNNIGDVYLKQGNYAAALDYQLKFLNTVLALGDSAGVTYAYNSLGDIYLEQGNYQEALKKYYASLRLKEKIGYKQLMALSFHSIGKVYFNMGDYKKAGENLNAALKIYQDAGHKKGTADIYISLGELNTRLGQYAVAEKYFYTALQIAKEGRMNENSKIIFEGLSELYLKQGNHKKSLENYKFYIVYRDSLNNEVNTGKIMHTQLMYEFDKKIAADSLKNLNEKKLREAELIVRSAEVKKARMQFWFVVLGLVVVSLVLLLIYSRFKVVRKQKKIIEYQNNKIVESINYSKKIQDALLPDLNTMNSTVGDLFILYEPRDIVSGDFYWYKKFDHSIVIACVDCTGHGVPGAFMSSMGSLLLDKVVDQEELSPSEILNKLNAEIIRVLHQQEEAEIQDGMDISICKMNMLNKTVSFSGARNGVIVVKNGNFHKYKADLFPVGGYYKNRSKGGERVFSTQELAVAPGDWLYMYTDGFIEQIGGEGPGAPMNYDQFGQCLIAVSNEESAAQKQQSLLKKLGEWQGNHERTDDVLILGFKIN